MTSDRLRGNLDLLLLSVLAAGPRHGYSVITTLRESSDGEFDLLEGTVYPALQRLERAGLLSSEWDHASGRRRRTYALTERGQTELVKERTRWAAFVDGVHAVLSHPATTHRSVATAWSA
jgi:PadR family transcriptional regulator PadR